MTKKKAIFLGISVALLLVYIIIYIYIFISIFFRGPIEQSSVDIFFKYTYLFFILNGVVILSSFALMIYFIIHLVKNKNIPSHYQAGWVVAMCFIPQITFLFYWYRHIWKSV